ncbi:Ribosome biogenesis protein Nop16 [Carpediemonas membranifera]|uniref:Nucleolar protein 16 n=1 Tax=Carpediemonas membranifera TaxID=201153 RepID=A0A8J6E0C3_9EUKA|nr:Ribosome biogenesis protein Nop16 [Carpediemonas membranifera]|eukprot:KAG9394914.1 Ribosome biogenesis protein Nop16 [Carpediemonas membranifera]
MGKVKGKRITLKPADYYAKVAEKAGSKFVDDDDVPVFKLNRNKTRHIPDGVVSFVERCHAKYNYDFDHMAADIKLNKYQKSPGQIRQLFRRYAELPSRVEKNMVGGKVQSIKRAVKLDLEQIILPQEEQEESSENETDGDSGSESESSDEYDEIDEEEARRVFKVDKKPADDFMPFKK